MREQQTVEMRKGMCCFKFAEMMLGLNMGMRVPVGDVLLALKAAEKAGVDAETGFFVAVAVGHRIHEHGDTLDAAREFASTSGVPDTQVRARKATAADVVNDCDINAELALALVDGRGALPDDVAPEIRAMAKVARLPDDFSDAQIIVALHSMRIHDGTLDKAMEYCTGDSDFAKAVRLKRLN